MKTIYAREDLVPNGATLFLAGPSPRGDDVPSWRPEALDVLNLLGFNGNVFVPEPRTWDDFSYDAQIEWEWDALDVSDVVAFWVPRDLERLPGFTTNVEFGLCVGITPCVLGYPVGAPKMRYIHMLADNYGIPVRHDLQQTLERALEFM